MEWRLIPGIEKYEVSNTGLIRFTRTGNVRKCSGNGGSLGKYKRFSYRMSGKLLMEYVHHAVAKAFIEKPEVVDVDFQVDHIDHDTHNNNVSNLRYLTASENMRQNQNTDENFLVEVLT